MLFSSWSIEKGVLMKFMIFYALGVYCIWIIGSFNLSFAGGLPAQTSGFPSIRSTEYPKEIPPSRPCPDLLSVCEKSCSSRGEMYQFQCTGRSYQTEAPQYRCLCGDDTNQLTVRSGR